MPDNKKLKRADGKRVALTQRHEREYLQAQLTVVVVELRRAKDQFISAYDNLDAVSHRVGALAARLRAGFHTTKGKRRGK